MTQSISRRNFLASSLAVTASTAVPFRSFAADGLRRRAIPGTDETLPVISLGAPDFFYKTPPEGDGAAKALIEAFVDMGGKMIDTPPFFRPDPPVIGRILKEMGLTDDLFLISKIVMNGKQEGMEHVEKVVANLGKRPMDLLMVHNMRDLGHHWATLKEWKEQGRVRYIGASLTRPNQAMYNNYTNYDGMEAFIKAEKPDFIMPGYSAFRPQAAERVLPAAADNGVAVIIAEPFRAGGDGSYFGLVGGKPLPDWVSEFDCESWAQFALKYIAAHPAVTSIVTETSKVKHVVDNMRAGYGRLPDQATRQKMREYLLSL